MNIKHLIAGINPENLSQLEIDKLAINAIRELELKNEELRQQLAQQPSVDVSDISVGDIDVLLDALRFYTDSSNFFKPIQPRNRFDTTMNFEINVGVAKSAIATYEAMNEAKPIEKDVK